MCFCIYMIFATVLCIVYFDQFAKYEVCKMVDRNIALRSKIREQSFADGDESRHRLGEVVIRKWLEEKEEVGTPSQLFFSQTQNYCQLLFRLDRQHLQNKIYVLIIHPHSEGLSVSFACISHTDCLKIGLLSSNPESHCTYIWLTHKERGYCVNIRNFQTNKKSF